MDVWNQIIGGGFVIGAIFWAGATYSRIGRIEEDVKKLIGQLGALGEIGALKLRIANHDKEIVMLRQSVYGDNWRNHGGPGMVREEEVGT